MRIILTVIVLLCLYSIVYAAGTTVNITFYSASLDTNRNVQVHLPEGYDTDTTSYPVIYFLHGVANDHTSYPTIIEAVDSTTENGTIEPVILIKPDGSIGPYAGSMYTNSELYGQFEDYIVYDLVNYIDSNYRTIASGDKRSIMGHSMGGYGSMKLIVKHPDIFCAVASHSGPLDLNHADEWKPKILAETYPHSPMPPYTYSADYGVFSQLAFTACGAFTPNLDNSPEPVDFILDDNGNMVDTTFAKWIPHNPAYLANSLSSKEDIAIYFDCGEEDELDFLVFNDTYADSLDKFGINYRYEIYTGGHTAEAQRYPISLAFLDSAMNYTTDIETYNEQFNLPKSFAFSQNYPNPFNPSTVIKYQLPSTNHTQLNIYNIKGQLVKILVNEMQNAGYYNITWDGKDNDNREVASGLYIYRITAGNYMETKRMLLLK